MKKIVVLGLLLGCRYAVAQNLLGITGSNYAGTNALYHNPAQAADSRHKLFINLATFDNFLTNNYVQWDAPYSFLGFVMGTVPDRYRSDQGLVRYRDEYFPQINNSKPKRIGIGADLRGPSVLYTLNDRIGLAGTTRIRALWNVRDVSEPVAKILRYGTAEDERVESEAAGGGMNLNINGYAEIGGTVGVVLLDADVDFVKVGVTVKRLVGLYSGHLLAENLDYRYVPDPADRRRENILIENVDVRYGFTTEAAFLNARPTPRFLLGRQSAGGGWGMDLGVVYEFRPDIGQYDYRERGIRKFDPGQNKYRFRLSLSLMDLGGIRYRNPAYVSAYDLSRTNQLLDGQALGPVKGGDAYVNAITRTLNIDPSERQTAFNSSLPTTVQASLDVNVRENVYVNAMWVQRVRRARAIGALVPNTLAVTPRYERKWLEVALPVSVIDDYRALTVGLALRLGPVFVGSDHLPGLVNLGKPKGYSVYAGANIPILRRRPPGPDACWYEKTEKRGLEKLMFWKK